MRLSTRLTALLIAITAIVGLLVGSFAVTTSTQAQYRSLVSSINAVAASGVGHPSTALSGALKVIQENNLDLSLDVVDQTGVMTQVSGAQVPLKRAPTLADIKAALKSVRTSPDVPGFEYRALSVGGGDYLIIAGSISKIAERTNQLIVRTIIVGLFAALTMGVVARLFIRRDLRAFEQLTSFASGVAEGDVDRDIPPAAGSSDVRQLQDALARMVRALRATIEVEKRSAATMQRFIGDASHELRTPLTVIKGYAELLATREVPVDQQRRALERVQKEVGRMDSLVNDLLFLAEVSEVGGVEHAPVNLSEHVAANTRDFIADHADRAVETSIDSGIVIEGRDDYVERLIVNAFVNIARHTAANDPVRVTLRRDGEYAVLRIEDGGPGMPENSYGARPKQFQRFDQSRSRSSGGSGLGMSIMADVASAMGGLLTTSKSDLGGLALSFSFRVPAPPT